MNKLMYMAIVTTGLVLGVAMLAHTMSPATATAPTLNKAAGMDINALHSNLNVHALPSGDLDDGIYR